MKVVIARTNTLVAVVLGEKPSRTYFIPISMNTFETKISTSRGESRIVVGNGLLAQVGAIAAEAVMGRRVLIVTDENVRPLYLAPVEASLVASGFSVESMTVPPGETSKSVEHLTALWSAFNAFGLTRSDLVVALGGGVVGDLAGFAAATYLRGCAIIQVPTTLLAQVDSSIGGKTGIDLPFGKNLAGAFHQPKVIVADPRVLLTLPDFRFAEGMAEVVKYGCIYDEALFARIEAFADHLDDEGERFAIITRCMQLKADVVNRDVLDTGERMILNFGHTVGHAIEHTMGYGRISHGEAVAIGMVVATRIGERVGRTPAGTTDRLATLLKRLSLPIATELTVDDIFQTLLSDKKKLANAIHFILLERVGHAVRMPFEPEALRQELEAVWCN